MATSDQQVVYLLNNQIALLTLASGATLNAATQIDGSRLQGALVKKLKGNWRITNLANDQGPILFGFTTGLSTAEVTEALLADPQSTDDVPANERGNRKVFPVGMFTADTNAAPVTNNPLMWRRFRFPWPRFPESQDMAIFAHNLGGGTLTTGAIVRFDGVAVTEWLDD